MTASEFNQLARKRLLISAEAAQGIWLGWLVAAKLDGLDLATIPVSYLDDTGMWPTLNRLVGTGDMFDKPERGN